MGSNVHDRYSGYFSYSTFEVLVASPNYVYSVLFDSFYNAVVSISSFVVAFESLKAGVLSNFKSDSIFNTKFLKFSDHAVWNVRNALPEQTIHRGLEYIEFVLDWKVDEIGIEQNSVGRTQRIIVVKEQTGGLFGTELKQNYISLI